MASMKAPERKTRPEHGIRPEITLTKKAHSQIDKHAQSGKRLDHFSPQALVAYGITGASKAHLDALKTARYLKTKEFKEVVDKLPLKLRDGAKKSFEEMLKERYPEPRKDTGYHA